MPDCKRGAGSGKDCRDSDERLNPFPMPQFLTVLTVSHYTGGLLDVVCGFLVLFLPMSRSRLDPRKRGKSVSLLQGFCFVLLFFFFFGVFPAVNEC